MSSTRGSRASNRTRITSSCTAWPRRLDVGDGAAPHLTSLDVAVGYPLGFDHVSPLDESSPARSPQDAMAAALGAALARPPCLISFSGGRDSSAMLAMAANIARREGL